MNFPIGESHADIQAILKALDGHHAPRREDWLSEAILAVGMGLATPTLLFVYGERANLQDRLTVASLVLFLVSFAVAVLINALATYDVSESGITKHLPFRGVAWTVASSEIASIVLQISTECALIIRSTSDRSYQMPLKRSLRDAFARLYPEVARPETTAQDKRRWKWLAGLLAAITFAVIGALWYLAQLGLVSWR